MEINFVVCKDSLVIFENHKHVKAYNALSFMSENHK